MTGAARAAATCVVVLLALNGGALVMHARSGAAPTFARGGSFVADPPPAIGSSTTAPEPTSTTTAPTTTSSSRGAKTTSAPRPTTTASGPRGTETGRDRATVPDRPRPPALGTYTYAVTGTEGASIVGSRSFPPQMTLTAHRGGGVGPDQVVLDQQFSPQHREREIARYSDDGVALTHEAGTISFGLVSETSDVSYEPPMGQINVPLTAGSTRSGTSTARDTSGAVARVDDWTTRVVGQETLTVAGAPAATWVVVFERRSRPGTEQVNQTTRYWFDPARGISVRWEETVHGERNTALIRATYDQQHVATLQSFRPG